MARGKLWEYAVLYHPKQKKDNAGNDITPASEIIVEPTRMLASQEKEVAIKASRAVPVKYDDMLDDIEIIVHPF
jgi:hypothetical protein